jgi:hypothetical protein
MKKHAPQFSHLRLVGLEGTDRGKCPCRKFQQIRAHASIMRLALILPDQLTPEQKPLYEDMKKTIAAHLNVFHSETAEGALIGPWNPWLHEPIIGGAVWELAKIITAQATLPEAARQMAILTVGSHFKAAYELYSRCCGGSERYEQGEDRDRYFRISQKSRAWVSPHCTTISGR